VAELWPVLARRVRAHRPRRQVPIKDMAADIVDLARRIQRVRVRELGVEA